VVSAEDVRSYVNVNLSRLERFVEREIYFREASDFIAPNSISKDEVIDETIAAALRDGDGNAKTSDKPERLALEPWLYSLAMRALDELSRPDGSNGRVVHLEDSASGQDVGASDEPELQFHQPDETISEEDVIEDDRVASPEQIVGSDEMMRLIAAALHEVKPAQREAFILHAIEGFGVDEISAITGAPPETVSLSIAAARNHLRRSPSFARHFKGRFAPTALPKPNSEWRLSQRAHPTPVPVIPAARCSARQDSALIPNEGVPHFSRLLREVGFHERRSFRMLIS
jgi:RNA polymerase sigma factor (sigma-70 family)